MTAQSSVADFDVETSPSKVTLLSQTAAGVYYIAVPAGKQITIYNGGTKLKATKPAGLTAGKYYTVTTGDVTGTAEATINGEIKNIGWVQLWAGGPKFATQNVAGTMTWTAAKENTFWGPNWRVPTKDEMGLSANYTVNTEKVSAVYRCNENGVWGFEFTGVTPGYTNVSLFLPAYSGTAGYGEAAYWTATKDEDQTYAYHLSLNGGDGGVHMCFYICLKPGTTFVRPILVEK